MDEIEDHKKFTDLRDPLEDRGLSTSLVSDSNFTVLGVTLDGAYRGQVIWKRKGTYTTFYSAWLWPEGSPEDTYDFDSAAAWLEWALKIPEHPPKPEPLPEPVPEPPVIEEPPVEEETPVEEEPAAD